MFENEVDALLQRANELLEVKAAYFFNGNLYREQYNKACRLMNDFDYFVKQHPDKVDYLANSELSRVNVELDQMKKNKRMEARREHYQKALIDVRSDIASMK
jgi:hypothetical protein